MKLFVINLFNSVLTVFIFSTTVIFIFYDITSCNMQFNINSFYFNDTVTFIKNAFLNASNVFAFKEKSESFTS